jgi:hypothetical protein
MPAKNAPVHQATITTEEQVVHPMPPRESVLVQHRLYDQPVAAVLTGDVLYSDQVFFGNAGPRRYFWLVQESVQLVYEPFVMHNEWYVDLVSISRQEVGGTRCFFIQDEYVDVIVEGMGPTYRILDLDEAADALTAGAMSQERLAATLAGTQRFLERYLHRGATFPPSQIRSLFSADHRYPSWSATPVALRADPPRLP